MSSSAAFHLAVASSLAHAAGANVTPLTLARIAQQTENALGLRVGILDPYAISHARRGHALWLDCRSLTHVDVPVQLGDHVFVVGDTKEPRGLVDSAYNERRARARAAHGPLHPHAALRVRRRPRRARPRAEPGAARPRHARRGGERARRGGRAGAPGRRHVDTRLTFECIAPFVARPVRRELRRARRPRRRRARPRARPRAGRSHDGRRLRRQHARRRPALPAAARR